MQTDHAPPSPAALAFIRELLTTGFTLIELFETLIEGCEQTSAHAGENAAEAVVEMAAGSVAVRLHDVPAADFDRATELMSLATDAILADLKLAAEIAGRRGR